MVNTMYQCDPSGMNALVSLERGPGNLLPGDLSLVLRDKEASILRGTLGGPMVSSMQPEPCPCEKPEHSDCKIPVQ